MKIYVLGAGSIGSLFGALLTRAGNDVTLIGREEHVRAIEENGLHISGIEDFTVYPKATLHAPPPTPPELLMLSTKSYSTREALECARNSIGPKRGCSASKTVWATRSSPSGSRPTSWAGG